MIQSSRAGGSTAYWTLKGVQVLDIATGLMALVALMGVLILVVRICMLFGMVILMIGCTGLVIGLAGMVGQTILNSSTGATWPFVIMLGSMLVMIAGVMGDALENG